MSQGKGPDRGTKETPEAGKGSLLQFKISLKGIRPPIWRRVLVPEGLTLNDLHEIIQMAMGWWNYHLHIFVYRRREFGVPDPDWDDIRVIDDSTVSLRDLSLSVKEKIRYEYDFGDGWEHDLLLEKILPAEGRTTPVCLKGVRACPPEDCGGPWGYENLLQILNDPKHPEHSTMKEWLPEDFDPEHFDLDLVNQRLSSHKWKPLPSSGRKRKQRMEEYE